MKIKRFYYLLVCAVVFFTSNSYSQENKSILLSEIDSVNSISFKDLTVNPEEMEAVFQVKLVISDSIGYDLGSARLNANLSTIYSYLGKEDLKVEYRLKAIQIYMTLDSTRLAGNQYALLGWGSRERDIDNAEFYMRKGLKLLEKFPGDIYQADAFNNYAMVKLSKGESDSALHFVNKSLRIKKDKKDTLGIAYSLSYLANIHLQTQNFKKAIQVLDDAYPLRESIGDTSGISIDYVNKGIAYQSLGDLNQAQSNYKKSLKLAEFTGNQRLVEYSFNSISSIFEEKGQYDSALVYYKNYVLFKDSVLNFETNARVEELQIQFQTEEKEKELAQRNAELSTERLRVEKRNTIASGLGGILCVGVLLSFFIIKQQNERRKNIEKESKLLIEISEKESENKLLEEKERISRDLHDNVGSQITNLITGIEISNIHIEKGQQQEAGRVLKNLDEDARNTMTDLRETIWLLDKEKVSFQDFEKHLKSFIRRQKKYFLGVNVFVESKVKDELVLNPSQSLNLMRIIQEALNNARKYAEANRIDISFSMEGNSLKVTVSDNGKGMNVDQELEKGNGLKNMEYRSKEMLASFKIDSKLKKGTTISLSLMMGA